MDGHIISVVIPVRSEGDISDTLKIISQRLKRNEIIVVDTSPQSVTPQCDSGVRYIHRPDLSTRAQAMNEGASACSGDWILFLHLDCVPPFATNEWIEKTRRRGNIAGAFFKTYVPSSFLLRRQEKFLNFCAKSFFCGITGTNGIYVEKNTFQIVGGFPKVPLCEDLLFMERLNRAQFDIIPDFVEVSSRRYARFGGVLHIARNFLILLLFHSGVSPKYLAKIY